MELRNANWNNNNGANWYTATVQYGDGDYGTPGSANIPPPNQRPVARAGSDQHAYIGDTVRLNGSASSDPDGDEIKFLWSFKSLRN